MCDLLIGVSSSKWWLNDGKGARIERQNKDLVHSGPGSLSLRLCLILPSDHVLHAQLPSTIDAKLRANVSGGNELVWQPVANSLCYLSHQKNYKNDAYNNYYYFQLCRAAE